LTRPVKRFRMSKGKGHLPLRTCVSCGKRRKKEELIRLRVNSDGIVVEDRNGKGQGRGAYVCENRTCVALLREGKRLNKAFRSEAPLRFHPGLGSAPSP
jgi:predicted RNA-binding protein YlxR (DUF448 family)